jgi:adenosine deaminase
MKLSEKLLRSIPKALLHDHLDGGLRSQTVIELARDCGYNKLPTTDAEELAVWFHRGATRGSLPLYLEGFAHTIGVMQTEESLERVAYEMMEDMRDDGVVYVETRFAPVFHTELGLHWEEIVQAVLRGLERGRKDFGVEFGLIICAMRNLKLGEMAEHGRLPGTRRCRVRSHGGRGRISPNVEAFQYIQRAILTSPSMRAGVRKESIRQAISGAAPGIGHATRYRGISKFPTTIHE